MGPPSPSRARRRRRSRPCHAPLVTPLLPPTPEGRRPRLGRGPSPHRTLSAPLSLPAPDPLRGAAPLSMCHSASTRIAAPPAPFHLPMHRRTKHVISPPYRRTRSRHSASPRVAAPPVPFVCMRCHAAAPACSTPCARIWWRRGERKPTEELRREGANGVKGWRWCLCCRRRSSGREGVGESKP